MTGSSAPGRPDGPVHMPSLPTKPSSDGYHYPYATAPDIIRSHQKDAYFQTHLLNQLNDVLRPMYGARFVHKHALSLQTIADLFYYSLTTLRGNRTLGEEYTDIVQISSPSLKLPAVHRRAGYILSSVLFPYLLTRLLPSIRRRLRQILEADLRSQQSRPSSKPSSVLYAKAYLLRHLDTITSPSPVHALTLTAFYFFGSYYHLSKRIFGLRYIFARRLHPSEQRAGYEVLGVLLVLQFAVQAWLHTQQTLRGSGEPAAAAAGPAHAGPGASTVVDGGIELGQDPALAAFHHHSTLLFAPTADASALPNKHSLEVYTQTPALDEPRYDLHDTDTMQWIQGRQQRKCTLCLEEMRDPSATTCGHVFCWTCIGDWCREKPECPLCRQESLPQHILPLRG